MSPSPAGSSSAVDQPDLDTSKPKPKRLRNRRTNKGETGTVAVLGATAKQEMYYFDMLPEDVRRECYDAAMPISAPGLYEEMKEMTPEGLLFMTRKFKEKLVEEHLRIVAEACRGIPSEKAEAVKK